MPEAMAIPCPRCGAKVGEWCPPGSSICHDRDHAWRGAAGRPSLKVDWRMALAWYMFHIYHCEGITFVRKSNGMNCMPPEFKKAIQEIEIELEALQGTHRGLTKPDGSIY